MTTQKYGIGQHPNLPPPHNTVGVVHWLRVNLFNGFFNTLLTIGSLWLIFKVVPPALDWLIFNANFEGDSKEACTKDGACWVLINVWFKQYMYGRYPDAELWRVNLTYILAIGAMVPLFFSAVPRKIKGLLTIFLLVVYPVLCAYLFVGGSFGLPLVETSLWGGLFLTLVIAVTGIVMSLPLGILLALGRRSDMPVVKSFCVIFIEFWRGIPLITVLFMASVMFPMFVPHGMNPDKLVRALIGVTLFSSAYEAAAALGLNYWKSMVFVILPQALKMVIPGIVNTFIGLFKDTTLVIIIGLFDLLGMAQASVQNTEWLGLYKEGYVFAAFGFFIFCFGMSRYSQYLERQLDTGHRN